MKNYEIRIICNDVLNCTTCISKLKEGPQCSETLIIDEHRQSHSLRRSRKSTRIDNIPGELNQAGGETMMMYFPKSAKISGKVTNVLKQLTNLLKVKILLC